MAEVKKSTDISEDVSTATTVLGTFEGECADSNITNENGLDITRPVWETVFASEDYKKAIELGHYIGFLGHPEDPNCMDFEHACIVMTEGHIEDDGKVYGKFNLIDTPVGRIVKSFIDAGVTFGISVRGAGDIIDNSVDPETFIFRGFDLVTFPAYKDAVPTFTKVAAASDVKSQQKYKSVCAAVRKNIKGLNTVESVDILQSQFGKQSDEYSLLESRKQELEAVKSGEALDISAEQVAGVTKLLIEAKAALNKANIENRKLRERLHSVESASKRKVHAIERIVAARDKDMEQELIDAKRTYQVIKASTSRLKSENSTLQSNNLKYKHKIEAAAQNIRDKDSIISGLRSELSGTAAAVSEAESRASNRDDVVKKLRQEISAATKLIQEYQEAYAALYANAVGVNRSDVKITASTSPSQLQAKIRNLRVEETNKDIAENSYVEPIDNTSDESDLIVL